MKQSCERASMPISRRRWRCWIVCAAARALDVVILTREGLDDLAAEEQWSRTAASILARSYVGIAVKAGADHPDIATETALRATLLGRASGLFADRRQRHFLRATDRAYGNCIRDQRQGPDRPVRIYRPTARRREADLAVQQISELKAGRRC